MTSRRVGVASSLLLAALVAWAVVILQARGMDRGAPSDLGAFGWFVAFWVTMTAAMMLPSAAPTILLVDRLSPRATPLFAAGYLVLWTAFGVAAYALVRLALAAGVGDRRATGPLVAVAGLYQLSPLARTCLTHCRAPLAFLRARAGDSPLRAGAAHGAYCVGCCAGLMLVLFAVGVMSLTWTAVVACAVAAGKLAPHGDRVATLFAVGLVAAGTWVAFA